MSPEKSSEEPSASETVTSPDTHTDTGSSEPNLLKFDDASANQGKAVNPGKDINTKITALDTDLAHLRSELGAINSSVEEGLDRLSDTDTDLTAKVSETYKRLGEIDNAYKSLLEISSRIDVDIQKLNGDVSTVAEVSASGIKNLAQSTVAQSTEFTHKNQQVVSRVNQLVETSKLTSELLNEKVKVTTDKIIQVEQQVVSEIQNLSAATGEKTKTLEDSIDSNKAKIFKLQSVDEAIIKRATTLEISSAELSVKSQELMNATDVLEQNAKSLSAELSELQETTRKLEATTNSHGSLIRSLQTASSKITHNIIVLSKRENRRFSIIVGGFVMLVLAVAVMFFVQYEKFGDVGSQYALLNSTVDSQITGLQQEQTKAAASTNDSLLELEDKVTALIADTEAETRAGIQDELTKERALVENRMQKIQDQLQSVEGRFNNSSAFAQIADDNIIHSAQWISAQDKENYTLQVAYVNDKQVLFELAQSYNHYLKDSLSYFEVSNKGNTNYVLLSGSYPGQQQALEKIKSLPAYIDMQRPVLRKFSDVQEYIGKM